jgi:hypothetical protein
MQSYAVGHSVVYLADAVVQSGVIDVFAVLQHFGVLLFPVVGEYHLVLVVCEHESFYYPVLLFVVLFSAVQFLEMILEAAYFLVSQKVSQKWADKRVKREQNNHFCMTHSNNFFSDLEIFQT